MYHSSSSTSRNQLLKSAAGDVYVGIGTNRPRRGNRGGNVLPVANLTRRKHLHTATRTDAMRDAAAGHTWS